jgi:hypothetical protein
MRIASITAALVALVLLVLGGVALWGNAKKDDDGYLSTSTHRFATSTYALASEELDLDFDGYSELIGRGKVRVDPRADGPVFVGIARTRDVSRYLRGTEHTLVTDVETEPFRADYRAAPGNRPAAPGTQSIWAASAHGAGAQTLTWDVKDGDWSIVVMNDDGARGIDAGISVGAEVPWLSALGWALALAGLLTALLAATGLYRTAALSR